MYLYRFEVITNEYITKVVVAAEKDENAFEQVEYELEQYFLKKPEIIDLSLYEKRRIANGTGYVLYEQENNVAG
ncbi:DUF3906 family protein [Bacillus massilinigeriensis]|uniref:DUF3906 family protein n=1 Tax=Bacillus massilionigeriensis TaxID=1805475 RepID=UPI00096B3396|nr:DUF3906 family protein [Bacillus massilionigeriensis]